MIIHFTFNSEMFRPKRGQRQLQKSKGYIIPERRITKVSDPFFGTKDFNSSPISIKDELIKNVDVLEQDILCGRGLGAKTNIGNVMFRSLVREFQQTYLSSKPFEKANIAKEIVSKITNNGARFLKKHHDPNTENTLWKRLDDKAAREKTCQALRERVPVSGASKKENKPIKNTIMETNVGDNQNGKIVVNDKDVLLGRGGVTNTHPGNKKFRSFVRELQQEYVNAPKLKKADIALRVVNKVYLQGGRFLVETQAGKWEEVSKERARKKTSQTLREKSPHLLQFTKR
mmetsp:Transcript_16961/g.25664  ORF Transcript_16961/g.25664 Transcript_16961/m.25664 type:complete len:287 (-) Transcript_16961:60-920(-)